jgi:DNA replication and repair protein RecF
MNIRSVRVQQYRSHHDMTLVATARVMVIVGKNGSGKTTLLEAIYSALRGTSFRGSDIELLQRHQTWWRIDVESDVDTRTIKYDSTKQAGKKTIEIAGRTQQRMPLGKKYPCILFEPDDLRLLQGSPSRRRQFLDTFIAHISPEYSGVLRRYERALRQRNALLKKSNLSRDDVFVWDVALSEYGAEIIRQRTTVTERINASLQSTYASIADTDDTVSIHYSHTLIDAVRQKLMNELTANFMRDRTLGYTTIGPHRHDLLFEFNGSAATSVASRGEVRSIVVALKFIEVDIVAETTGLSPIILLDDVFGELDDVRQKRLSEKCRDNQMFITSTHAYRDIEAADVISLD